MSGKDGAGLENDAARILEFGSASGHERPLGQSVWRGVKCTCPNCGEGRLFGKFIKPVDHCAACGEDFRPQRADDLPAYIVALIIGHVMVGGFLAAEVMFELSSWAHLAIWVPVSVLGAIALLQPVKGGVIGLQWALRMHGFGGHDDSPADILPPA
jgi:uncharacterized protein (DUF983 family)